MSTGPPCQTIMIDKENNLDALVTNYEESLTHGMGIVSSNDGQAITATYEFFQQLPVELNSIDLNAENAETLTITVYNENASVVFNKVS